MLEHERVERMNVRKRLKRGAGAGSVNARFSAVCGTGAAARAFQGARAGSPDSRHVARVSQTVPAAGRSQPLPLTRRPSRLAPDPRPSSSAQRGITGIETAIILIAFVVVSSVFAFTVLNSGLFAAEAGRDAVFSSLEQASGSLQPRGSVRAMTGEVDVDGDDSINLGGADQKAVTKVVFTVTTALDKATVDLTPPYTVDGASTDPDPSGLESPAAATFQTDRVHINEAAWTVTFPGTDNGDYILDQDEKAEITVWLQPYDTANDLYDLGSGSGDPFLDESSHLLGTSQQFSIQLHAPNGPTMTLQRTTPRVLRGHMDLR